MPTAAPLSRVNDFVIRFANVNGSGSASANEMFARAVMRMGVPVSPRNIFPSNIQGLPTWYEVRVTEAGHMGARGGTDFMVAMNPQTFDKDIAGIEPGGYLLYDSTKPYPKSKFRDDITVIGVPLTAICNREYTDPRQRQLFKNIIYLGVMSALLDMDVKVIEQLIGEQYKGKDKLIEPNIKALHIGRDYATLNLECPIAVKDAARKIAFAEDQAIFDGYAAAQITGVRQSSSNPRLSLPGEAKEYPDVISQAVSALRLAGVDGPYSLLLSADAYTAVSETSDHGYPVREHIARLLPDGEIIWAPALSGAVVLTGRGGDYELRLGQELSIGYLSHDASKVELYFTESFTFAAYTAEASVSLGA